MELLSGALRDQRASFMDHLDLIFKWTSLRLCEKENVKAMGQVGYAGGASFGHNYCDIHFTQQMQVCAQSCVIGSLRS